MDQWPAEDSEVGETADPRDEDRHRTRELRREKTRQMQDSSSSNSEEDRSVETKGSSEEERSVQSIGSFSDDELGVSDRELTITSRKKDKKRDAQGGAATPVPTVVGNSEVQGRPAPVTLDQASRSGAAPSAPSGGGVTTQDQPS